MSSGALKTQRRAASFGESKPFGYKPGGLPVASSHASGQRIRVAPPVPSLSVYAADRLAALCAAAGFGADGERAVAVCQSLLSPWGDLPLGMYAAWLSEISDDNTPIEFSVTIADGRSDVRMLFETQAAEPTLAAYRAAGLAFQERLGREFGADLRRFRKVQDLFLPEDMEGPFAVWNSVVFSRGRPPLFKAYFNPQARGRGRAPALVEEALERLGLHRAWAGLCRAAVRRGPHLDEVKYFALDLTSEEHSRVKVYVRHHSATPEDLEVASSAAEGYVPGEALDFARAVAGGAECLSARATFTCSAFVEGQDERPAATTLYVPVCAYARDDAAVVHRVTDYLAAHAIDSALYNRIVEGFANRPLEDGVGMQSWVALRRYEGIPRLTAYLATEATRRYRPGAIPAATGDRLSFASAEEVVRCLAAYDVADHPFVQRMKREKANDGLAQNELIHDLLRAMDPIRPSDFPDTQLGIGHRLSERVERHYASRDLRERFGSLIVAEVCGQQLVQSAGESLRSLSDRSEPTLFDRFRKSNEPKRTANSLARARPRDRAAVDSFRQGAMGVHQALWEAFDELYVACFGTVEQTRCCVSGEAMSGPGKAVPHCQLELESPKSVET
jgi:hypothetical protein